MSHACVLWCLGVALQSRRRSLVGLFSAHRFRSGYSTVHLWRQEDFWVSGIHSGPSMLFGKGCELTPDRWSITDVIVLPAGLRFVIVTIQFLVLCSKQLKLNLQHNVQKVKGSGYNSLKLSCWIVTETLKLEKGWKWFKNKSECWIKHKNVSVSLHTGWPAFICCSPVHVIIMCVCVYRWCPSY